MDIKLKREKFLEALYWSQGIVERRHTMPLLANVLLEAHDKALQVSATDLEVGVRAQVESEVKAPGQITLNAKKLYEIVREVPEDYVNLKRLSNDWAEIRSGKSVFKVVGMDGKEFPQFPPLSRGKLFPVSRKLLKEMIEKTLFSVSSDETRRNLSGVYMQSLGENKIRMVATDGHRLALLDRTLGSLTLTKGAIVPRKGIAEIKKLLDQEDEDEVAVEFQDSVCWVARGNLEIFVRLVDEDFPDYTRVIPKDNPFLLKFTKASFLQALRRVSILSSERYRGVKIDVSEGKLVISANNPDLGEASEEVEVDYQGKPLTVGFNARYLMDVLSVLDDGGDIDFEIKDSVSPGLLRRDGDDGYLYVIMPMRL